MFRTAVLLTFLVSALVTAQEDRRPPPAAAPSAQELQERVAVLEKELARLRAEVERLKTVEARLAGLERLYAQPETATEAAPGSATASRPAGPEPMPAMPYDEDLYFLVKEAHAEASSTLTGATRNSIEVRLLELPPDARKGLEEVELSGSTCVAFPDGVPAGAHLYRMTLEDLGDTEVEHWLSALEPVPHVNDGKDAFAYRRLTFERIPTSQTHRGGYEGNSGTIRTYRGRLHWYENNVFFLEDGALRVLGGVTARFHLRFPSRIG